MRWDFRKTIMICATVMLISIAFSSWLAYMNRATSRPATQEELDLYAQYDLDMSGVPEGMTKQDFILSLSTEAGEEEFGEGVYMTYTSETVGQYLFSCAEVTEIAKAEEDSVYVTYRDEAGRTVLIGFLGNEIREKAIFDPATNTFFVVKLDKTIEVWENFTKDEAS